MERHTELEAAQQKGKSHSHDRQPPLQRKNEAPRWCVIRDGRHT